MNREEKVIFNYLVEDRHMGKREIEVTNFVYFCFLKVEKKVKRNNSLDILTLTFTRSISYLAN